MEIELNDIKQIMALLEVAKEFRPLLKMAVDLLTEEALPEVRRLLEEVRKAGAEARIQTVKQIEAAGFTREEAITLAVDAQLATSRLVVNMQAAAKR